MVATKGHLRLDASDVESIARWVVAGLALVLQEAKMDDREVKRLRPHDIFSNLTRSLYRHRGAFVEEARRMFSMGPDRYLAEKKREL